MKVILSQDIPKVGRKNEIKEVSDGYARNFLFPKNLAKIATPSAISVLSLRVAKEEREKSGEHQRYEAMAEKMNGLALKFKVKIGEKGRAFGSVTPLKVAEALKKQGVAAEKDWILLKESIKTVGEHKVKVKLPQGLIIEIKIIVESE